MRADASRDGDRRRALLTFRSELAWLEGYPLGRSRWQPAPEHRAPEAPIDIDGPRLSRAHRALRTLLREHRDELARICGDPDDYAARAQSVLDHLKRTPPRDLWNSYPKSILTRARRLETAQPELLAALSWLFATRGDVRPALTWIERNQAAIRALREAHASWLSLSIALMRIDRSAPLLALLGDPKVHRVSLSAASEPATLGTSLIELTKHLTTEETAVQRRAIELLTDLDPARWIESWSEWRRSIDHAERKLKAAPPAEAKAAQRTLKHLREHPPAQLGPDVLTRAIAIAAKWEARRLKSLRRLLQNLPQGAPGSIERLLAHSVAAGNECDPRRLAELWRELASALPKAPQLAGLWRTLEHYGMATAHHLVWIEPALLERLPKSVSPRVLTEGLALAFERGFKAGPTTLRTLSELFAIDPRLAPERAAALAGASGYIDAHAAFAARLAGADLAQFVAILERLHPAQLPAGALHDLLVAAEARGLIDLLREEVLHGSVDRIARWSTSIVILGGPPPLSPAWRDKEAEREAERIKRKLIPAPEDLDREIEALQAKLQNGEVRPGMEKRLQSLLARRSQPPSPSAATLRKLREKLARAAARSTLARFEDELAAPAGEQAGRELGLDRPPSWWSRNDAPELFAAVRKLPPKIRSLGFELMRRRHGPKPWNLYDRPENARFLAKLEARGLKLAPWLDSSPIRVPSGDAELILNLEDDPLEIFLMGQRFQTCLSIGGSNFFSAIVNAADANKRVLYARTKEGGVAGRCLLALTREGRLLTFQPFCHHGTMRFDLIVQAFVRELAEKMNTQPTARGQVPVLVAPDWYDDGPRDLTGAFKGLEDGSALRKALPELPLETVVAEISKVIAIDELTLPLLLALPEVLARPELVLVLAPFLRRYRELPPQVMLAAAELAAAAGARELVVELVREPEVHRYLTMPCARCGPGCHPQQNEEQLKILARHLPQLLLRIVRDSTPRRRHPAVEQHAMRLRASAIALDALARPAQAARAREKARALG